MQLTSHGQTVMRPTCDGNTELNSESTLSQQDPSQVIVGAKLPVQNAFAWGASKRRRACMCLFVGVRGRGQRTWCGDCSHSHLAPSGFELRFQRLEGGSGRAAVMSALWAMRRSETHRESGGVRPQHRADHEVAALRPCQGSAPPVCEVRNTSLRGNRPAYPPLPSHPNQLCVWSIGLLPH